MNKWKELFILEAEKRIKTHLLKWAGIVEELGPESKTLEDYVQIVYSNIDGLCVEMIEEMENMKSAVGSRILEMLEKCDALCKELSIQIPEYGKNHLSLFEEQKLLAESIME